MFLFKRKFALYRTSFSDRVQIGQCVAQHVPLSVGRVKVPRRMSYGLYSLFLYTIDPHAVRIYKRAKCGCVMDMSIYAYLVQNLERFS